MAVLTIGSHVDAYTITKILYHRIHLDIYEVTDHRGEFHILKLYKNALPTDVHEDGNDVVSSFVWNHMKCLIYATKSGDYDYFSISSNGNTSSLERAGTMKKQSNWIVRTPMPFRNNMNESDEDDDEDEEEEDDDDENGYGYGHEYDEEADESDDDDDEEDEDEDSIITFSNSENEKSSASDADNKIDNDSIVSILLHDKPVKKSSCHINILSPVQRAFHSTHKAIRRTPIPDFTETHNMDVYPSQLQKHEQERNNSGCNFELKMVASSMLKRREAKSLAM